MVLPDVTLQVTEWPGEGDPVLLLHATGFHSRCWACIARELPDVHIYAVDARFHGGSDRHGEVNWLQMAGDMEALLNYQRRIFWMATPKRSNRLIRSSPNDCFISQRSTPAQKMYCRG